MADEQSEGSPSSIPSWQELSKFIEDQTKRDRDLIDKWFKLASTVLGALVIVISGAAYFFLGRTINDATQVGTSTAEKVANAVAPKAAERAAQSAAQSAATDEVKRLMQDPRIRNLVDRTAEQSFANGQFRAATERAVQTQLPAAIATEINHLIPGLISAELSRRHLLRRDLSESLAKEFLPTLGRFKGERVGVLAAVNPLAGYDMQTIENDEAMQFKKQIEHELTEAGLDLTHGGYTDRTDVNDQVISRDPSLADVLTDLISRTTGQECGKVYGTVAPNPQHRTYFHATKIFPPNEKYDDDYDWPAELDAKIFIGSLRTSPKAK